MDRMLRKKEEEKEKERFFKQHCYTGPVPDTGSNKEPDDKCGRSEPDLPKNPPGGELEMDKRLDKWIGVPIRAVRTQRDTSDTVPETVNSAGEQEPEVKVKTYYHRGDHARSRECCQFRHGAGQTGLTVSVDDE